MRVLANIFTAMQFVWSNGPRRRKGALRRLMLSSGLFSTETAGGSKAWLHRKKARGV